MINPTKVEKKGKRKGGIDLRDMRKQTLLQMNRALGISDSSTHAEIRRSIDECIRQHLRSSPLADGRCHDKVAQHERPA